MSKCYVFMFGRDYSKINRTSQPFKCQALQRFMSLFRYLFFFSLFVSNKLSKIPTVKMRLLGSSFHPVRFLRSKIRQTW